METLQVEQSNRNAILPGNNLDQANTDELTLQMATVRVHESPMPERLKYERRANSSSLSELFDETLANKGEEGKVQQRWVADDEMEVEGLSKSALHSFILEAEELGKKITYTETLRVKISD